MLTNTKQTKIALYGFDERSINSMVAFLRGPCLDLASVAVQEEADIDVFDHDVISSRTLLEKRLEEGLLKPAIVLSLHPYAHKGVIHLKKPVGVDDMLDALEQAKKIAEKAPLITVEYGITKIPKISLAAGVESFSDGSAAAGDNSLNSGDQLQQISDWFDAAVA